MAQGTEIICRFTTTLEFPYKVSESEINIQTDLGQAELTQLLAQLLQSDNQEAQYDNVEFDFIVGGSLLKTTLGEHIQINSISSEKTLNITYILKLSKPELKKKQKVDDWIVWIKAVNNLIYAGLANSQLVSLNHKLEIKQKWQIWNGPAITYDYMMGDYIISSHVDYSLRVSKISNNKTIQPISTNTMGTRIESISVNQEQPTIFCAGGQNGVLYIFDLSKLTQLMELENQEGQLPSLQIVKSFNLHKQQISSCQWINNDQILTGSYDHSIIIFSLKKELVAKQYFTKDSVVSDVVFNSSENTIISSHEDGYIKLWDIVKEQGFPYKALNSNGQVISKLKLVNKHILLSCSFDGSTKVWDLRSDFPQFTIKQGNTKNLYVTYEGDQIYFGGSDSHVYQYQMKC